VQAQVKLRRISGMSVGLYYSWFIIPLLIVLSLAGHSAVAVLRSIGTMTTSWVRGL
jgi:hypothetical protein